MSDEMSKADGEIEAADDAEQSNSAAALVNRFQLNPVRLALLSEALLRAGCGFSDDSVAAVMGIAASAYGAPACVMPQRERDIFEAFFAFGISTKPGPNGFVCEEA